jgi:hypothetical protein
MGPGRLLEPVYNRLKGMVLLKPKRQEMHAHKRQTGLDLNGLCARDNRGATFGLAWAPLAPIERPLNPHPMKMADAHGKRVLHVGGLFEQHPARAYRVLVEQLPQEDLIKVATLSPSVKGWTGILIEVTLARGEVHGFILLDTYFRMKSAHSPL